MATTDTIGALEKVEASIRSLLTWEDGWNSYGASAPSTPAVQHALVWMAALYNEASALGLAWLEPNVTAGPEGAIVFEWWHGTKKLTIYVDDTGAEYVQVWGPDVDHDMAEGNAETGDVRLRLWQWLTAAGSMSQDLVGDDEILYRRVPENRGLCAVIADGQMRFSSQLFADREKKASVDRARLCNADRPIRKSVRRMAW